MVRKEQAYLYVVSLLLSILLWAQVNIQSEQVKEKEFTVPIEYRRVGDGKIALTSTDLVSVVIAGKSAQIDRIEPRDVKIFANLVGKKLGEHQVKLLYDQIPDGVDIQLKRQEVSVTIEELVTDSRQVEVTPSGTVPTDLIFERAIATPRVVEISGPKSVMESVRKVRAIFDLTSMKIGVFQEQKLEALDKNGDPLRLIRFEPNRVEVSPISASGPMTKNLIIVAKFTGQPAFGFSVKSYEISVTTALMSGTSDALKNLQTIDTEAIDLGDIKGDKSFNVLLKVPKDVDFGPETESRVKVFVRVVPAS